MREKAKEIVCPDCLRKRLRVFQLAKRRQRTYFIIDPLQKQTYELEPWQLFVLEVLSDCENHSQLSRLVEDRYGLPVTEEEVDILLHFLTERRLFAVVSETPPVLADFDRRRPRPPEQTTGELPRQVEVVELPSAVARGLSLGGETSKKGWALFDPTSLLRASDRLLTPLRRAVFLVPLVLVPAVVIAFRYHQQFADDLAFWFGSVSLLSHLVLGLLTVNLLATFATALVAYHYGVTVSAICVVFYFGVWPRFAARVGSVEDLPRRARAWFHAAPLITRLAIFGITMLVWFADRGLETLPARFSLSVAIIAEISFLITAIPLIEGNGYRLLATLVDEPKLRQKATLALVNRLRRTSRAPADNNWLLVYAVASALFIVALIAAFFVILGRFLGSRVGGGATFLTMLIVASVLWFRVVGSIRNLDRVNTRAARFAGWRKRETPEVD